jgi:hypothetical protein
LIAPIAQGGLQLQDIQTKVEANKITWITNICNTKIQTPWKAYLQSKVQDSIQEIPLYNSNNYEEIKPYKCTRSNQTTPMAKFLYKNQWKNSKI